MTSPNQPVNWFPGVHTGPRVAITVTPDEIDVLRDMTNHPRFNALMREARKIVNDLDVRLGAARELDADPAVAPLQPHEFAALRTAYENADRYPGSFSNRAELRTVFTKLLQRLGAEQVRRAGSGEMTAEEIPQQRQSVHGDGQAHEVLDQRDGIRTAQSPSTATAGRRPSPSPRRRD